MLMSSCPENGFLSVLTALLTYIEQRTLSLTDSLCIGRGPEARLSWIQLLSRTRSAQYLTEMNRQNTRQADTLVVE